MLCCGYFIWMYFIEGEFLCYAVVISCKGVFKKNILSKGGHLKLNYQRNTMYYKSSKTHPQKDSKTIM